MRKVPATPTVTTGPTESRSHRQPMYIPPLNRMRISATVTICSTAWIDSGDGSTSDTAAAPSRKIAGAGTRTYVLIRFDSSATETTAAATSSVTPNGSILSSTRQPSPRRAGRRLAVVN